MSGLEKATLTNMVSGKRVVVQFNPEEYTLDQQTTFAQLAVPGLSAPVVQFVAGNAQTVQMDLLVDTTENSPAGGPGADVRILVRQVTGLMDIDPTLHAPPPVVFAWGQLTFTCVMTRVAQTYLLFRPDGTPVRARLSVTLSEYRNVELEAKEIKRQTVDYTKVHIVCQGDSLSLIAQQEYSDATAWRPIALRNGITDPRRLTVGAALLIPRLPYVDASGVVHVARPTRETYMSTAPGYAPEIRLLLDTRPVPTTLRASVTSVNATCGFGDADRMEVALANEGLRWLDSDLFRLDTPIELWLGYSPDQPERVFAGEVVGSNASFPSTGMPTLTIVAQDRRTRLATSEPSRWFGVPVPYLGVMPLPDIAVAPVLALEHGLLPIIDPLGALLSAALGAVEAALSIDDPTLRQHIVRKQAGENTLDFLKRIAAENAWEIAIDHEASPGGLVLTLMSPAGHLAPDVTLRYGHSLLEFMPRVSTVGQVAKVTARVWQPSLRLELGISVGFDWDRQSLEIEVSPGFGLPVGGGTEVMLVDEPISPANAARVVLGQLLPRLNRRITATGSCPGNAAIRVGHVIRIEGVGETYGGLWRVTSLTQTVDSGGWRTSFEARKEIWFGSIPPASQGAVRVQGGLLSLPAGG